MSQRTFFPQRFGKLPLVLALAASSVVVLTTGCANMTTTAPAGNAFSQSGSLSGMLHGGNQPIGGATVDLWTVGTTGYGSKGTKLATTTTAKDGTGSFSFNIANTTTGNYTCPSSNTLLYIIASGGNTLNDYSQNYNNTAAVMVAAVGACGTAGQQFIDVNEVSSVATTFALAQYMNTGSTTASGSTTSIGTAGDYTVSSPNQAGIGLINAFATVGNLASIATGTALTSSTKTGTAPNVNTAVVTVTPETAKINTIANIIAACVNNASSTATLCGTLFGAAVPPADVTTTSRPSGTFPTAGDTLQAAYYMAINPTNSSTSNLQALYGLTSAAAPFQPSLTATTPPTDWTIGVLYSSGTTTCTAANTALFINYSYANSVDASGNVWLANGGSSTANALTEMSPTGQPLNCSPASIAKSRGGAVIDTAGNVWGTSDSTAFVYKFDGTNLTAIPTTGSAGYAIGADGKGNVFFTDATLLKLYELPSTATAATVPTVIGTVTGASPFTLAVDTKGTVVVGQSGSGGSVITAFPTTTVGGTAYPTTGQTITSTTNYAGVYGVAFDASGNFWIGNSAGTSLSAGTAPGNTMSSTSLAYGSTTSGAANTVTFTPNTPSTIAAGGLSTARVVAIDGAGNVWTANNSAASSGLYGVSEFSKSGAALSPTSTATSGSAVTENGGFQKASTFFSALRGVAIDPSGNVWVTSTNSTSSSVLTEIVGAAVPAVTPISAQMANGTAGLKP